MSRRSAEPVGTAGKIGAALAGLALAAAGPRAPARRTIEIDVIPGPLGSVRLPHAAHVNVGWKVDRSPITCRDCHHTLAGHEPAPSEELRCSGCHPAVGEPDRMVGGRPARAMARLKPDGAIDYQSILFHDYCRGCHQKVQGGELRLGHCKLCHPRGIVADALHRRFDGVRQAGADLTWLRCPAGQRWSGKACQGQAVPAGRERATEGCPEGFRLPSRQELLAILECTPAGSSGEPACRPCAGSRACTELLGPDAGTYWVASPAGEPGLVARLSDGTLLSAPAGAQALVRCVQGAR